MAELAFEDRLQPALLDRLSDDARTMVAVEVRAPRARLAELGVTGDAITYAVRPYALRPWRSERDPAATADADVLVLRFLGPADVGSLARVRAAPVAAASEPVALGRFAEVATRAIANLAPEPVSQRVVSMQQLRESVLRDLSWLLGTTSYDSDRSLDAWPEVRRSVLNYGLPSVAGIGLTGFDADAAAGRLQKVIELFEPRLTHVRVTPEGQGGRTDNYTIGFRVEAELWGQPTPQQLLLRTQIDIDTAEIVIRDSEAR